MPILKRNGKTFSGTPTKVDTAKSYTTFDSADDKNPTTWSDVELLTSKEEQRSLFSKISTMFKNIRYLYKILGTTDISHYSDGTVTGAIKSACDKADANETAIADVNNKLGNTDISAVGDGTLTGGLSVLSNNAYDLKMLGWTVPKECPVQNYVDEDGVFHQIVGRVDLSKLMWEWADTLNEFRTDLYIMGMNPYSTNIYCSKYKFGSEMYISGMGIYIKDPNYDSSTISQFKADNKGVYFYYELATEITKPVDGNEAIKLLNDKLGNTDISAIGDGTVTGGLNALNSNLNIKAGTFSPYSLSVNDLVVGRATYYKIGKFVYISMLVSTNKTITDNVTITGLPFVPSVDGLINLRIVGINCGATPINSDGKIYLQDHLANDLKYSTVSGRSILISGVYTTNE